MKSECVFSSPHPNKTHIIIYIMYNLKQKKPQVLYIGNIKKNAFTKRKAHIQKAQANKTKNLPVFQYINCINLGILLLMSVANYNQYLHYYERYWIHKLKTHTKSKSWYQSLNKSKEHATYIKLKPNLWEWVPFLKKEIKHMKLIKKIQKNKVSIFDLF